MLYLHIGLHKTGTTFLQKAVFPLWQGLNYLPLDKLEYLVRMSERGNYLLSREGLSGQNWMPKRDREACIVRLAKLFPDARIIMSFRQHAGFIVSSYNQFLQRGGFLEFEDYFNLQADQTFMAPEDFLFRDKIDLVASEFGHQPHIILHQDIVSDIGKVITGLEGFMGGKGPAVKDVKSRKFNKSVGHYPSKILRTLNRQARSELNPEGRYPLYHWRLKKLGLDPRSICQYSLGFLPDRPLLSRDQALAIDGHYEQDWQYVLDAAARSSETVATATGD